MVFRCSGVVGRNVYQFFILAVYNKHRLYEGRSKLLRVASGDFVVVAKPQENGSLDDDNDRLATVTTLAWVASIFAIEQPREHSRHLVCVDGFGHARVHPARERVFQRLGE